MSRPLIGITSSARRNKISLFFCKLAIWLAGGKSKALTPRLKEKDLHLHRLDGYLIGGGDDISAHLYKGKIMPDIRIDPKRDELEQHILQDALTKNIPVLGICRGAQMINIVTGGNLHSDIYEANPNIPPMRTPLPVKHIEIEPDSKLFAITGASRLKVNSIHHQAVDKLGYDLTVAARDGHEVIQAIEDKSRPFLIGVQWHPEYICWHREHFRLFKSLVSHAIEHRDFVETV